MMGWIWGLVGGLLCNELFQLSGWVAQKLVCWSARLIYEDPERSKIRTEELARLIEDRPGQLLKLIAALSWVLVAVKAWATRTVSGMLIADISVSGIAIARVTATASMITVMASAALVASLIVRPETNTPPAPVSLTHITGTFTYQQNELVYFEISYSDPGHDAAGFGFTGADGSDWPTQHYSFSDPADGIVETNSISYPLNQGCGTGREFTSSVKAWIYDRAGHLSKPVIIHLACTT
jgi:hypothetical protein